MCGCKKSFSRGLGHGRVPPGFTRPVVKTDITKVIGFLNNAIHILYTNGIVFLTEFSVRG